MKKLFLSLILLAGMSQAQTTVAPFTTAQVQLFDASGVMCSGCQLSTFAAGTTTPLVTYSDSGGTVPNANPIVLASDGTATIFLTSASYKFVLKKSVAAGGATIRSVDNISWSSPLSTFAGITDAGNFTQSQPTAATSGANQSSFSDCMNGNFWTGSVSSTDSWCFQDVLGTGSNPTSTFTLTHSGSSGTATWSIPSAAVSMGSTLAVTGATTLGSDVLLSTGKVIKWNSDTGLSRDSAAVIDVGNGTQGDKSGTINATSIVGLGTGAGTQGAIQAVSTNPVMNWNNTGGGVDSKRWDFTASTTQFQGRIVNDAVNNALSWLTVTRSALTITGITFANGGGVQTLPTATDTLVGKATTDTLTNKTLNGAANGNAVTLLNEQGPLGAVTGTGADVTLYTFSIPANVIAAGKGIRVTAVSKKTTGTGLVTYKLKFGSTTLESPALTQNSNVNNDDFMYRIFNNSAVQNAQHWTRMGMFVSAAATSLGGADGTAAENTTGALSVSWIMNAANTEQVTPKQFIVELIQ